MQKSSALEKASICLLGQAVGDALGLPMEGLSRRRLIRWYPTIQGYHFVFRKGLCSDDTEHARMTAQAILEASGDVQKFTRYLAWKLRWWLLGMPAGIGFATLRSIMKLWLGYPASKSGVFSAGNGPCMRSPILGLIYGAQPEKMIAFVHASTRLTHSDPKAFLGALAIAYATYFSATEDKVYGEKYIQEVRTLFAGVPAPSKDVEELLSLLDRAIVSANKKESTYDFLISIGIPNGITGYVYHTVPCVIHAWIKNTSNFLNGLQEIIYCGGDTDTTASILGGILAVHQDRIPSNLLEDIWEWPVTIAVLKEIGYRLSLPTTSSQAKPVQFTIIGLLLRNIIMMCIVIVHGFRRLFP